MATRPRPRPIILAALPGTMEQLEAATGFWRNTIWRHLKSLRADGEAHIGGWAKVNMGLPGIHWVPVYHAGPGPDVPCRFRKMSRDKIEERRQKRIRDTGEYELICAKKRLIYWENKARTKGDPLVNALFGASTKKGEPRPCK